MSSVGAVREKWAKAGQEQVFQFWDKLSSEDQTTLLARLDKFNPEEINQFVSRALNYEEPETSISPLPETVQASVLDASPEELAHWRSAGLAEIKEGKVAVLLLAGGQGTRLGSSAPKGCYDIGLPTHKSLFQLQAERIAKVRSLAGSQSPLPWYIMTSGPTRAPTEAFFKENNYFGLPQEDVIFFEQGVLPCITNEGKVILETPSKPSVAPDGNGGVYKALSEEGILKDMKNRGIEHVHMYCVDNSLVKVADPTFIGFASGHKASIATKVVRKRSADESVGLIVAKDGKPGVIEYSEISKELREAKDERHPDLLKYRAANIVNHYYSREFLESCPALSRELPLHVARKKIPFADPKHSGETTKPTANNGIKLEQFVFDIFSNVPMKQFACLEVARSDEFSPVKNGPGSGVDCPETARDDLLDEGKRWLLEAGAASAEPVEIAASVSYGGEGLEKYSGKAVTEKVIS